ncbi:MAG: hypothetical protein WCD47_23295 [Candidatus Sulfotelmatobacter sp.]
MTIKVEPGAEETPVSELTLRDLAKLIEYVVDVQGRRHESVLLRLERIADAMTATRVKE